MKNNEISIRLTVPSEAEELCRIQKAAFKPLYQKYHDEGNPYLRGVEDILRRINKNSRYFTILYGREIAGGIVYRLKGKRTPCIQLEEGEYYLGRVYIKPELQGKGIARKAILLCEKEFPDAKTFYVDFPEDMEKNRRCYSNAGYRDTGKKLIMDGNPPLAMFEKIITEPYSPKEICYPMIYKTDKEEISICNDILGGSLILNENNIIKSADTDIEVNVYGLYAGKKMIGCVVITNDYNEVIECAVLPEYRDKDFNKILLDYANNIING